MSRDPKTQNLFIKNCVSTLMCLNFSHLPSIFHLMQYTYTDIFSTAQNSFWTHRSWCLLVLPFFVSPLPHWQNISLYGLFSSIETKKSHSGWDQVIGRVGLGGHAVLNTQHSVDRWAHKSPIMKWANTLSLQKIIHWSRMQPLTAIPAGTLIQMGS